MDPFSLRIGLLRASYCLVSAYDWFIIFFISVYYYFLSGFETNLSSYRERLPQHIAMSFTNESDNLDLNSIARLLSWCKQLGINQITLYDQSGRLKDRQEELLKKFVHKMQSYNTGKSTDYLDGLNVLSRSNGSQKFIEDVRELVKLDPEDLTMERVNDSVGWQSDPEMLISFGSPLCLHGFPPWPLRLTEMFSIPTHRRLPQRVFLECLNRYTKTSQRIGT